MISFRITLLVVVPLLFNPCVGLTREDISFVRYFVKDWKGYDSVNIFSCPGNLIISDLNILNNQLILFRYMDIRRPIDIDRMDKDQNCRQVYVVDLQCREAPTLIKKLSESKVFSTFCRSFLFLDSNADDVWFEESFRSVLNEIDLTVTSDVVYATKFQVNGTISEEEEEINSSGSRFFLYDIWNPGRSQGGTLKFHLLGKYRNDEEEGGNSLIVPDKLDRKFLTLTKETPIIRRFNLSEVTLQCAIVVISRFNETLEQYLTHHYKPYLDTTHRLHFSVVRVVKDMFQMKLFVHRTNSWGYLGINSSDFDGMIGMLQRKEIDIGCSPAFYRLERMIAVDYGEHTWGARPMVIFRHPSAKGTGKNVFRVPFNDIVWVVMVGVSAFLIISFTIMLNQEYVAKGNRERDASSVVINISRTRSSKFRAIFNRFNVRVQRFLHDLIFVFDSIILYIGVICQQGAEYAGRERYTGTRFGLVFLFIFSFLMIQFYSASITGSLLMAPPKNIRTIPDLVASSLEVGMQEIVYNYDFFRHTTDPDALELYNKKIHVLNKKTGNYSLNFFSIDEGLSKMQHERFAFHVDRDSVFKRIFETFNEKDICDLHMIRLLPKQMMGTVTQRGSPFRKILNYGIHRAAETGILFRERMAWITKKPGCLRNIQTDDLQVELAPLKPLLKVFIMGVLLSVIILIIEKIVHNLTIMKRNRR